MEDHRISRRNLLKIAGLGSASLAISRKSMIGSEVRSHSDNVISVDTAPQFELSPYLYMQFMEPLGVTDSSVDAAWDFWANRWREDVVEITQELAPTLMRWGGCFCSYYRWMEGVGQRAQRKPMLNVLWGGIYNNQVGTDEFVDFCSRVGADPLVVVNFESDGRKQWATAPNGDIRSGDANEAARWVDYCNNPSNALRISNGVDEERHGVKLWQIGNETSYDPNAFDVETAGKKTVEFAKAMRQVDSEIDIIGWGDSGWAPRMAEIAGEELQYLAFHNGFRAGGADSPLQGIEYRKDPARTWEYLMRACHAQESRIKEMREQVAGYNIPLALTECHFSLPGRNRCEVLSTWAAGVANARTLNVHQRNGDLLKIATLADFCGTRS
jgi:alpha-N-arabinofuranosidase